MVGIRLDLLGQPNPDFVSPSWQQFLGHLVTQRWQVELLVEARRLPAVIPPLLRAGVTRAVVDQFGRPDSKLGIDDPGFRFLLSSSNAGCVWVKLSGACRNGNTADMAARSLLGAFGPTHLVWGSDWPHSQFETVPSLETARKALDIWVPDLNDGTRYSRTHQLNCSGSTLEPRARAR